jgi:hypothetical protein
MYFLFVQIDIVYLLWCWKRKPWYWLKWLKLVCFVYWLCGALAQKPVGGKCVAYILDRIINTTSKVEHLILPSWSEADFDCNVDLVKQAGRESSSMVISEPATFWPVVLRGINCARKACWCVKVHIHVNKHRVATVSICGRKHYLEFILWGGRLCNLFYSPRRGSCENICNEGEVNF